MKSVADLNADDFPGINPEKFYEWKTAAVQLRKNWLVLLAVLVALNLIVFPLTGRIVLGVGLLPLLIMFAVNRRPSQITQRLGTELGLDAETLRDARRGVIPARFRGL